MPAMAGSCNACCLDSMVEFERQHSLRPEMAESNCMSRLKVAAHPDLVTPQKVK